MGPVIVELGSTPRRKQALSDCWENFRAPRTDRVRVPVAACAQATRLWRKLEPSECFPKVRFQNLYKTMTFASGANGKLCQQYGFKRSPNASVPPSAASELLLAG